MNPQIEQAMRALAAAIVDRAAVPAAARDDLAEELFGHLVERWRAHVADGLSEDEAAQRAIAEFGNADSLAREFGRTYHSRVWASTIGVLLPASVPIPTRPPIIGWLRLWLAIVAMLMGMALVVGLWFLTLMRALLSTTALGIGLSVIVVAFQALARGQRWALRFAAATLVTTVALGLWQLVSPAQPDTIVINVLAILAALVLIGMYRSRAALRDFAIGSGRVSLPVSAALVLSLLAPMLVPNALAAFPDPTQAVASDLTLRVSMRCDRNGVPAAPASTASGGQRITLLADMTWRRGDLLPGGLAGLFRPPMEYGDTAGLRIVGDASAGAVIPSWLLPTDEVSIVDLETGATAGWFGAGSPSTTQIPDTVGSLTIGVERSAIRAGHTIRATWVLTPTSDSAAWPRIEVAYAHLDRFLLLGTVGCGETTPGRPARRSDTAGRRF